MTTTKYIWTEQEKPMKQRWMKPLLPFATRLKMAEANLQRRMKKHSD